MSKVNVKPRSGKIKKTSDRQRTRRFWERQIRNIDSPSFRQKLQVAPDVEDDPLGAANANILLRLQAFGR